MGEPVGASRGIVVMRHADAVSAVAFSPDGGRLISASMDRTLVVWDAGSGERLATLAGHHSGVTSLAWSPDGRRVVSGSWDDTVRMWDAWSGDLVATLEGHDRGVGGVAWSPDGAHLASASGDRTIRLWDAATRRRITTLRGHEYGVTAVRFSPDSTGLVSASGTYVEYPIDEKADALLLWDVASHKRVAALVGHRNVVRAVAFSPGGGRVISGSDDWTVRVFDIGSGVQLGDLIGHRGPVHGVAYGPGARWIVSGSSDGAIKLWEGDTFTESHTFRHPPEGVEIATVRDHEAGVNSVDCSPDGRWIASGSDDCTVRIRAVEVAQPLG
ncbi:WD40 repeat domain-containing protein [Humibacillus xanthopallidus]|nr:WD40 repeat domain-containing protein [Humibacillus xanthopallidus]